MRSKMTNKERATCFGKVKYKRPKMARAAVVRRNKQRWTSSFTFYKCPFCSSWHITYENKWIARAAMNMVTNHALKRKIKRKLKLEQL